jgi:hypothetical protein
MPGRRRPGFYRGAVTRHRNAGRVGTRAARVVAVGAIALAVFAVALPVASGYPYLDDLLSTPEVSVALAFSAVGVVLVGRQLAYRMGWLVVAIGGIAAAYTAATSWTAYTLAGDSGSALPDGADLALVTAWVSSWAWFPVTVLIGAVYPQVLPYGRPLGPRWRVPLVAAAVCLVVGLLSHVTEPGSLGTFTAVQNPLGWEALHDVADPVWRLLSIVLVGLVVLSLVSLALRFRRARGVERWQVGWFAYAVAVAGLLALAGSPSFTHPAVMLVPAGLVVTDPRPLGRRRAGPGRRRATVAR